ncbi:MAG TPA: class I SAM-dependent methyltransferase [Candidatus Paceibacterota bacterium]|nr:class I SAM-dependent methyltransferase [Candidatus Pacearchaeota archaeon]HRR94817.1 class I SAM-dependent methyltransferase [Candidatus Paceibacterota bacterium]HRU20929.1 class I SAM-dependent methyltransferase [Candidatus Paceibacterota bacterium]
MGLDNLPEAYAKGQVNFLGAQIDLTNRPFIPREETEFWVEKAIKEIKVFSKKTIRCLDVFAGSGCIGIAILKNVKNTICDFVEIDNNFLRQIEINLNLNKIDKNRYQIIQSDIFSNVSGKYNFILANPPYVAEERIQELGEDVRKYEPGIALLGGKQGMDFIKIFLEEAFLCLENKGVGYIEIDPQQKELIKSEMDILVKNKNYSNYEFWKDQFGRIRVLRIIK